MELATVVSVVVPAPEVEGLARGKGTVGGDDLAGSACHYVFGSGGEDDGSGHRRAATTHDVGPFVACQLSWLCNLDKHRVV
jgi:hypothetical protein